MAIYGKPVRLLMKDMIDELGLTKEQILTRDQVTSWFSTNYPKVKPATIAAHLIQASTNAPSRIHYKAGPSDDLLYQIDSGRFRLYDPERDPPPIYEKQVIGPDDEEPEPEGPESSGEFAYESDLKNFLAKNLDLLEPGLKLYEEEDVTGVEFPVGGRFVDILALDSKNDYVVIELKVSRGYDRVVGQLLRYMAWIEKHQADPSQKVRGVIVAREISEDLLLAASRVSDVELFEYELSVSLKKMA